LTDAETLDYRQAGRLRCWSYATDLREWLIACRDVCAADRFRHFLGDFIEYIGTDLRRPPADPRSDREP
jgi:hypothetical protein